MAPIALSPAELVRYSRHILLPEIAVAGQEKLSRSRVLVIGAGGLGSPVSMYLAAAGVGTLGIAEFDRVEEHNLQRQILHDTAWIGRPKLQSALERLRAINPHIQVVPHDGGVNLDNVRALFAQYDVIVDGTDNFPTRYLNNDAAFFERKPLIYGSIFRFEGQVSVFDPARGAPCYRCLFPEPPPPGSVPNCGEAGVLGALCGTIGSLQAMEAIKVLLDIGEPLRGRLVVFDALALQFRTLNLRRDPDCPLCGREPKIRELRAENYEISCAPEAPAADESSMEVPIEVTVGQAHDLLRARAGTVLLDVREPHEHAICQIPGSRLLPMGQVPANLATLPRDQQVLVMCHHGGRSLRVTQFLRAQGFERVTNIRGGIDAWAQEIDPALRRY